ncbi:MAG: GDCCVxC domain-containing (seleno)protein [Pseudomonadota bacterium]
MTATASTFRSTIRCPACGHRHEVDVPTDRCVLMHNCPACGVELRRQPGSCCVYCAYPDDAEKHAAGLRQGDKGPQGADPAPCQ